MAGRLRVHTEANNNALTLPDYFTGRFEDNSRILRIISAGSYPAVLHHLLCLRHRGRRASVRKHLRHELRNRPVGRCCGDHPLYLRGGFLAVSWTDTVQASLMIFALILTPVIVIFTVGGFGESLEVIKQKSIENVDMLKGLNFVAIVSLMAGVWATSVSRISWRALWRRIPTTPSFMPVASA